MWYSRNGRIGCRTAIAPGARQGNPARQDSSRTPYMGRLNYPGIAPAVEWTAAPNGGPVRAVDKLPRVFNSRCPRGHYT